MNASNQPSNVSSNGTVRGWILDLYLERPGEIAVWIKTERGDCVKVVDKWNPFFYVSAPTEEDLVKLTRHLCFSEKPLSYDFVDKFVDLCDAERSKVLRIEVPDVSTLRFLAGAIWRLGDFGKYRLWNVDVPVSQVYLYDRDLFPLAYVEAKVDEQVSWSLMDSAESLEYPVPHLKIMRLKVEIDSKSRFPSFEDPIGRLALGFDDEEMVIDSVGEGDKIVALTEAVQKMDPDIIFTDGGDSFLFTYLARRALENGLLPKLVLGREKAGIGVLQRTGSSYFSYGRVYYRASPQRLLGRLHIDVENSGLYAQYGLEGLVEVARTCRIPLHRASRVSIGTCMTAIQLYQAFRDDVLIPWKKSEPENFKTAMDLLVADRGGFYFEPKVGIHNNVGEIDFSSMYPMLML
ncbi:hypothetical protein KEJ33_05800, partial [Candidatus Bathyarchaeota archaeon]|nr:hypothetical protein [Candidatus Bathyarchaeota archaeon]